MEQKKDKDECIHTVHTDIEETRDKVCVKADLFFLYLH